MEVYDVVKRAESATWGSKYFEFYRFSLFEICKFISCEKDDLLEIKNTLIPLVSPMKDFTAHYVTGKDKFKKLYENVEPLL